MATPPFSRLLDNYIPPWSPPSSPLCTSKLIGYHPFFARYWVIPRLCYICTMIVSPSLDCLIGLVGKVSTLRAEDPGVRIPLAPRFFRGRVMPGTWRYRVSAGTGQPSVSILWLGEMESLVCNFYLSVAARKIVWADPPLRYTGMLLGRQAINKQQPYIGWYLTWWLRLHPKLPLMP